VTLNRNNKKKCPNKKFEIDLLLYSVLKNNTPQILVRTTRFIGDDHIFKKKLESQTFSWVNIFYLQDESCLFVILLKVTRPSIGARVSLVEQD